MIKSWSDRAWAEYLCWIADDKSKAKKINELLKSIERDGVSEGIGKPEPLKNRNGEWSRRIDQEHRLVYSVEILNGQSTILIVSCKGHYED